MGRFLAGLIIGLAVGIFAMAVNPNLPQEIRLALANATALVMRGAGEAAQEVGKAADEVANEAEQEGRPAEPRPAPPAQ
jgi:hypothetical protein